MNKFSEILNLQKKIRLAFLGLFLVALLAMTACSTEETQPGVIARINGETITLHSLQSLLDSRSSSLRLQSGSTFEEMRATYCSALNSLIITTLARQELDEKSIAPSEGDLNQAIERITSDYGKENIEPYLEDAFLRLEDWRKLMKDHLALEIFRNQILLPGIQIEFDEAKNYYNEHKNEFTLPETLKACFLAASTREVIVDWCKKMSGNDDPEDPVAQCVEVRQEEIPQPWNREFKSLAPKTCGKIREEDGEWQSIALLERNPSRIPELSEVYPLVEKILLEPKQIAAFENWLSNKLASSRIYIAPDLRVCLSEKKLIKN